MMAMTIVALVLPPALNHNSLYFVGSTWNTACGMLEKNFQMSATHVSLPSTEGAKWAYLPKDEESIGAVRREGVCVASIADPGSKNEAYSANIALKQRDGVGQLIGVVRKPTALLKPYRDTSQGVRTAAGM